MIPNAIVIAFDERVEFQPTNDEQSTVSHGTLRIPLPDTGEGDDRSGWVVDGQQRLAAIGDAAVDKFPIVVVGFVAGDEAEQREQFILVNATRPLPRGLIYELLPSTEGRLPTALARRRFPALLLDRLNRDDDSPFRALIRTPTNGDGVVQDNSILRMLENSLSDGVLYRYRGPTEDQHESEAMLRMLKAFWAATANVFADAWGLSPRRSRLMHGAGIVSMGFLMDAIGDRHR